MCDQCRLKTLRKLGEDRLASASSIFTSVPKELVDNLLIRAADPNQGAVVPEPAWFSVYLAGIDAYFKGDRNLEQCSGFSLPLSARSIDHDQQGLPRARFVPAESHTLRQSVTRLAFSSTARQAIDDALAPFGIAVETFSCGGIFVFPREKRGQALADIRPLQLVQSKLDQSNREEPSPIPLHDILKLGVDLDEAQVDAIYLAHRASQELAGTPALFIATAVA